MEHMPRTARYGQNLKGMHGRWERRFEEVYNEKAGNVREYKMSDHKGLCNSCGGTWALSSRPTVALKDFK